MRKGIADKRTFIIRARDADLCRYPDMMAMISNWDDWQGQFDFFLETKVVPSESIIGKHTPSVSSNGGSLLKLLERTSQGAGGHIIPRSEFTILVNDIVNNPGNATYMLDLLGALGDDYITSATGMSTAAFDDLAAFCSEFDQM
jgi:hypothetical protein